MNANGVLRLKRLKTEVEMEDTGMMVFTVEAHGESMTISIPDETTAYELLNTFKTIMTFLTYSPKTIEEIFAED